MPDAPDPQSPSVYRICPLLDDPFVLPDDAPGKTDDGAVWVRWASAGAYAGWYAVGTRAPERSNDFWGRVYALAAAVGSGSVDAVHTIGPGVLALGGLGVTMASGLAQELLRDCLKRDPVRWMECMAPVLAYPETLRALGFTRDSPMMSLEQTVRGTKAKAKLWVQCCSHMLRDDRFDEAQVGFLAQRGQHMLGSLAETIGFARVRDTWSWSQEQQAVWAVAVVMALADPGWTATIFDGAIFADWADRYPDANGAADATLRALRDRVLASAPGTLQRLQRAIELLQASAPGTLQRLQRTLELLPTFFTLQKEE